MSKRASLTYQVTSLLKQSFTGGYGRSRHADKKNALSSNKTLSAYTKDKIYSRNTYNSTRKICVAFVNFCKEEFKVRYLHEIKPEMFNDFIRRGNVLGKAYEENTAATYYSSVKKLENVYNSTYGASVTFAKCEYKQYTIKNVQLKVRMASELHDGIIRKAYEQKYKTGLAFDICRALGLRVSEVTNLRKRDFTFRDGKLEKVYIHKSKGGRCRSIYSGVLSEQQISVVCKVYDYFKDILNDHDRLFLNKKGSYEAAFRRVRDAITCDDSYTGCGIHSFRKEFAEEYYNRELEKRLGEIDFKEAIDPMLVQSIDREVKQELTKILGHNRLEVLRSYLE